MPRQSTRARGPSRRFRRRRRSGKRISRISASGTIGHASPRTSRPEPASLCRGRFAGRRVRPGTCPVRGRCAVIRRTNGAPAVFRRRALGDAGASGWRAAHGQQRGRRTGADDHARDDAAGSHAVEHALDDEGVRDEFRDGQPDLAGLRSAAAPHRDLQALDRVTAQIPPDFICFSVAGMAATVCEGAVGRLPGRLYGLRWLGLEA